QDRVALRHVPGPRNSVEVEDQECREQQGPAGGDRHLQQRQMQEEAHDRRPDQHQQADEEEAAESSEVALRRVAVAAGDHGHQAGGGGGVQHEQAQPVSQVGLQNAAEEYSLEGGECEQQDEVERRSLLDEVEHDEAAQAADQTEEEAEQAEPRRQEGAGGGEDRRHAEEAQDLAEGLAPDTGWSVSVAEGVIESLHDVILPDEPECQVNARAWVAEPTPTDSTTRPAAWALQGSR